MKKSIILTENKLNQLIAKTVKQVLNEEMTPLSRDIEECLRQTLKENVRRERITNMVYDDIKKRLFESKDDSDMKRNAVIKALKDPKYNHAQLSYSLWPDMDKDTARSLFAKMANGTPDNDGVVRHFSDKDVNTLYQMIRKR